MKHFSFVFVLLALILLSISSGIAAVHVNMTNSQVTIIGQSTIKVSQVTVDKDGVPLPNKYWAVLQWDPINSVFVPSSYGPEAKGLNLRIFVTSTQHVGDFKNDPLLPGSTATQKADTLCNSDAAKPTSNIYKALIVDGVNRDAVTKIDWVLQPNTTYYRADGITTLSNFQLKSSE